MTVLEEELTSVKACITDLKDHLNSVIKEKFDAVKAENVEMRNHFNSKVKELYAITAFVNDKTWAQNN